MPMREGTECLFFNGEKFYKQRGRKYYVRRWVKDGMPSELHRYKWALLNGPIPKGFAIHHIDFNTENNDISNLECIESKKHHSLHLKRTHELQPELRFRVTRAANKASNYWHKTKEGSKWHSKHMEETWKNMKYVEKECVLCGEKYLVDVCNRTKSRFCCSAHKSLHRSISSIDNEKRECAVCGETYTTKKHRKTLRCSKCRCKKIPTR